MFCFDRKRLATKKRNTSSEQDSAAMQRYCDKLKHTLQKTPAGDCKEAGTLTHGHFAPKARFNVDQLSLEFDQTCRSGTWASAEERASGVIHIRRGRSGWEKRMATWQAFAGIMYEG